MRRPTTRQIAIPLVVLLVALAGCSGGGGGDGGNGATPTATATDDGSGTSPTPTATESGGTATDAQTSTTVQGGEDTATSDPGTETTSDSGTTTGETGSPAFSFEEHVSAVQSVDTYTVNYSIEGVGTSGGSTDGVQKIDTTTGERYATVQSSSGGQSITIEYYSPPNSETVYQNVGGQTQEATMSQAILFNISTIDTAATNQAWLSNLRAAGTTETSLGTANVYVIDSTDQLPESGTGQYSSVESIEFRIYVDQDTGIIARYDYRITGIQDEEEVSLTFTFRVSDLGSTTIERPDWVP
jgi:hypothetical protein